MKSTIVLAFLGIAGMLAGASCSGGGGDDPEAFCQSWVASACQALAGCCKNGMSFDPEECRLSLSQSCQTTTNAAKVETGQQKFDSGAASACFGTPTCSSSTATASQTYAQRQACANMLTGHVPLGAACSGSGECQQAGDFSTCYTGAIGTGSVGGVCAKVVQDAASCSFSFATGELHVCPDGMFCDRGMPKANPGAPPSQQAYEFSGSCKTDVAIGGNCFAAAGQQLLPCAAGLYCKVTGPSTATCTTRKAAGAVCTFQDECVDGFTCEPTAIGTTMTCQPLSQGANFCFTPTQCGNGICEPGESQFTCPKDCGNCVPGMLTNCTCVNASNQTSPGTQVCAADGSGFGPCSCFGGGGFCGDGVCEAGESSQTCPQDCM